jgi:hypothetical protein
VSVLRSVIAQTLWLLVLLLVVMLVIEVLRRWRQR